jgi:RNA polymerase primary sigma factor
MDRPEQDRQVELEELLRVLEAAGSMQPDDPVAMYLREIGSLAPLSPDLELELVAAVRSGDEAASYRLAELSLWEVVRMARQFTGRGVAFLDLVQEGNLGLIGAVSQIALDEGSFSELRDARVREAIERAFS